MIDLILMVLYMLACTAVYAMLVLADKNGRLQDKNDLGDTKGKFAVLLMVLFWPLLMVVVIISALLHSTKVGVALRRFIKSRKQAKNPPGVKE